MSADVLPSPVLAKPTMRGWLHLGALPAALVAAIVLVMIAPPDQKLGAAAFGVAAMALFGISATFHRGDWGPRSHTIWQRLDHSTIFIFIAASYTAFVGATFTETSGLLLLSIVWFVAICGVLFRTVWLTAPRWLTVPIYILLGWAAVLYLPTIWREGGVVPFLLMVIGGVAYTVGGIIYGLRRPDPSPTFFGYHEVFHSCTLGGYVTHYAGLVVAFFTVSVV